MKREHDGLYYEEFFMNDARQIIIVSTMAKMPKGKLAAQVAHASLSALLSQSTIYRNDSDEPYLSTRLSKDMEEWLQGAFAKVTVKCDSEEEMIRIYNDANKLELPCSKIVDNGRTVFNGVPTLTCVGIGPCSKELTDEFTGHLKLL